MSTMNNGKFIVIEGIEGAGKSSAIQIIEDCLATRDISYIKTREPGGTPLSERIREIVKTPTHDEKVTPECELLLMYASRSQLVENKIKPALNAGSWVIGDRHDMSSRAYQGGGRQFDTQVMDTIANITLKGFEPDLTIYLDIDPEIGLSRAQARGELDRIEQEKIDFFQRVRARYLEIAQSDEKVKVIDASLPMDEVHQLVSAQIDEFIRKQA